MSVEEKYVVLGANLFSIRNRNEPRVIELLPAALGEFPDFSPDMLDIEDIYALALNNLPARYVQKGSIVLREPVGEDMVMDELRRAIKIVMKSPNH